MQWMEIDLTAAGCCLKLNADVLMDAKENIPHINKKERRMRPTQPPLCREPLQSIQPVDPEKTSAAATAKGAPT
jgi:hypothetical protein